MNKLFVALSILLLSGCTNTIINQSSDSLNFSEFLPVSFESTYDYYSSFNHLKQGMVDLKPLNDYQFNSVGTPLDCTVGKSAGQNVNLVYCFINLKRTPVNQEGVIQETEYVQLTFNLNRTKTEMINSTMVYTYSIINGVATKSK